MASVRMVVAVRKNHHGDVARVRWGIVDTNANKWELGPEDDDVVSIVDELMAVNEVWTRLPAGTPGPKLKVVAANVGGGVETIECDDATITVDDLEQF